MRHHLRTLALLALLGLGLGGFAISPAARAGTHVTVGVTIHVPPPAPRAVHRPPPRAGYVWVPGYWRWNRHAHRHVWVEGTWMRARPGYLYRPPHWVRERGGWVLHPGHWVRR